MKPRLPYLLLAVSAAGCLLASYAYTAESKKKPAAKPTAATPAPSTPAPAPATPPPATPAPAASVPAGPPIPANDMEALRAALGTKVIVEGTPVRVGESKSKTVRFLDFGQGVGTAISLVFFEGKGDPVTPEDLQEYVGKKVRVTGTVTEFNSKLQMQVEQKSQIVEVPAE